jgi:hypothetical protein
MFLLLPSLPSSHVYSCLYPCLPAAFLSITLCISFYSGTPRGSLCSLTRALIKTFHTQLPWKLAGANGLAIARCLFAVRGMGNVSRFIIVRSACKKNTSAVLKNFQLSIPRQIWILSERRMTSSEMWRRVTLVRTDVSEELSASIIRVTSIGISSQRASVPSYG